MSDNLSIILFCFFVNHLFTITKRRRRRVIALFWRSCVLTCLCLWVLTLIRSRSVVWQSTGVRLSLPLVVYVTQTSFWLILFSFVIYEFRYPYHLLFGLDLSKIIYSIFKVSKGLMSQFGPAVKALITLVSGRPRFDSLLLLCFLFESCFWFAWTCTLW